MANIFDPETKLSAHEGRGVAILFVIIFKIFLG